MRIVCPNCTSQYEVGEDAIPEAGRDVQCANCSEIWFQERPMQLTMDAVSPTPAPQEPEAAPSQQVEPEPVTTEQVEPEPEQSAAVSETPETNENTAVFRSLRSNRTPTTTAEPAQEADLSEAQSETSSEKQRPAISSEVKNILQEEAAFAAISRKSIAEVSEPEPAQTSPVTPVEPVAEQPNVDALTRQMQDIDEQRAQLVETRAKADPAESVTLASAKSLRDILESEEIDPVDITDGLPTPAPEEPSLENLGLKRPTRVINPTVADTAPTEAKAPVVNPVKAPEPAKTAEPAKVSATPAAAPQTEPVGETAKEITPAVKAEPKVDDAADQAPPPKSGKAVFSAIDDVDAKITLEDTDDEDEDDLIDFDDEDVQKASRFSVGFLGACSVAVTGTIMYMFGPSIAAAVPATEGFFTSYTSSVDSGRMVLQDLYYQGGEPGFDNLFKNAKDMFLN